MNVPLYWHGGGEEWDVKASPLHLSEELADFGPRRDSVTLPTTPLLLPHTKTFCSRDKKINISGRTDLVHLTPPK